MDLPPVSHPIPSNMPSYQTILPLALCWLATHSDLLARQWSLVGIPNPVSAEYIGMHAGQVMLQSPDGRQSEFPLSRFSAADQDHLRFLAGSQLPSSTAHGKRESVEILEGRNVTLNAATELHITGNVAPLVGSSIHFTSADAWLFLDHVPPKSVETSLLKQMRVNGEPAVADKNIRILQYKQGTVIIPHGPSYPAMTVFANPSFEGTSKPLICYEEYSDAKRLPAKESISSFRLKRGYMATLATQRDGSGISKNYVAQDQDIEVKSLPPSLAGNVRFIRVFPWRWSSKKGVAGNIHQPFNCGWYYDWNISSQSSPSLEYVPIAQKVNWPNLQQDWKSRGSLHLLGFNEPDHKDQANLTVDQAINAWPHLLATGLRLGSPAVSDGGLRWLYEFMDKADAAKLRVDFVAVHYYRAHSQPADAQGAAKQFYQYLKDIHDRTKRPIWITEWNNGANWTKEPKPTVEQQKRTIAAMIKMLDETPFVERYALYNWVEDCRNIQRKDGSITPAGEAYRDEIAPVSYHQAPNGNNR